VYAIDRIRSHYPEVPETEIIGRLRQSTFVNLRQRYFYFEVPKAASSTLKWFLHDLEAMPPLKLLLEGFQETSREMAIHNRDNIALPSLIDLDDATQRRVLEDPDFLRLTIVRHPYRRIVSAWRSKIFLREPGFEPVYAALGRGPGAARDGEPISFAEFVDYIEKSGDPGTADPHWRLQTAHMFHRAIDYSVIGRVEDLPAVADAFRRHLGRETLPAFRRSNVLGRFVEAEDRPEFHDIVQSLYREDYQRLGYAPEAAAQPEASPEHITPSAATMKWAAEIRERNVLLSMLYAERDQSFVTGRQLKQSAAEAASEAASLRDELNQAWRERETVEASLRAELAGVREELTGVWKAYAATLDLLDAVYRSKSWRFTRPLRSFLEIKQTLRQIVAQLLSQPEHPGEEPRMLPTPAPRTFEWFHHL